jgi:hypothetical protein
MFFWWDIIFGTAHISRQYPKAYGISHYEGDQWYAQLAWPLFKSKVPGSELAADGPMVKDDVPLQPHQLYRPDKVEEPVAEQVDTAFQLQPVKA